MKNLTRAQQAEREEETTTLRELCPPGTTVYTVLRHMSRSRMYRALDLYVIRDNEPIRISWSVAIVTGYKYDRNHEAVGIGGCGMDMGFAIVHTLSTRLHCPEGTYTHEGAYALKHRWM